MKASGFGSVAIKFLLFGLLFVSGCSGPAKISGPTDPYLLEFGASWCPPCVRMVPLMQSLEKEEGARFTIYDIDTEEGSAKFEEWNKKIGGACPAIPLFINVRTKAFICGSVDYETLKGWALEKPGKK